MQPWILYSFMDARKVRQTSLAGITKKKRAPRKGKVESSLYVSWQGGARRKDRLSGAGEGSG